MEALPEQALQAIHLGLLPSTNGDIPQKAHAKGRQLGGAKAISLTSQL